MKERGIIFNTEMIKAILDGRKTQTRRIIKSVPPTHNFHGWVTSSIHKKDEGKACWAIGDSPLLKEPIRLNCPLGKIGDRLYVRETFKAGVCTESTIAYKATHKPSDLEEGWYEEIKWTPSIHMPRRYSRITLEITDVRVERLKDAGDTEFKAEGYPLKRELTGGSMDPFCWFRNLWDSVSPTNFKYADNPWVWVIEFKRI